MRRDLGIVMGFVLLVFLPFFGKAYHIDEPLFLAPARHILTDWRNPLAFEFNWYGKTVPMAELNNTPPVMLYALAAAFKLTGGGEAAMRLCFLPFDLLAACALYLLAARFLSRPLWPTLLVIAGPAYLVNMSLLYPEKLAAAFGFSGLYALLRGLDERRPRWVWASAALLGLSVVSKYAGIVYLPAALAFARSRRLSYGRLAAYAAAALAPLGAYLLHDWATRPTVWSSAWSIISLSSSTRWVERAHTLRSFLAFTGGCGLVTVFWPPRAFHLRPIPGVLGAAALVLLFLPSLDLEPVRALDRAAGLVLGGGALWCLAGAASAQSRRLPGWPLWAAWIAAAAALQLFVYWGVIARIVLLLLPPLIFLTAERLEAVGGGGLERLYRASFALVLPLSLALAAVDYRYAGAQRDFARQIVAPYVAAGRKVWFTGHWGLQYYLEEVGAEVIDEGGGGWERVGRGDVVLVSRVNSNTIGPYRWPQERKGPMRTAHRIVADSSIPLRLMSGWSGQGGFYADSWGFLPFSLSAEPLDEFAIGQRP